MPSPPDYRSQWQNVFDANWKGEINWKLAGEQIPNCITFTFKPRNQETQEFQRKKSFCFDSNFCQFVFKFLNPFCNKFYWERIVQKCIQRIITFQLCFVCTQTCEKEFLTWKYSVTLSLF